MNLLVTKKLPQSTLDLIKFWGWNYDVVETLEISSIDVAVIPENADVWILSSRNSWPVVQKFISQPPPLIYCVGEWLEGELKKSTVTRNVKSFENMQSLAADLKNQNKKQLLYFCADNHRAELENTLKDTDSIITKVITHKSKLTYPTLNKTYHAVVVFSPRSAESILKNNSFNPQTTFACIGNTTANYVHERGISNTFCASKPDNETLLSEFHEWRQLSKI